MDGDAFQGFSPLSLCIRATFESICNVELFDSLSRDLIGLFLTGKTADRGHVDAGHSIRETRWCRVGPVAQLAQLSARLLEAGLHVVDDKGEPWLSD